MLDVAALVFPSSGVVAGWWRQLAPLHPEALWVGHLFWRRVETLVQIESVQPLERFASLVLQGVALPGAAPVAEPAHALASRLHFPEAILRQTLQALHREGLVDATFGMLTDVGRQALAQGKCPRRRWERRSFTLLERVDALGQCNETPICLTLDGVAATIWSAPPWDETTLRRCLGQPDDWKQLCGFPRDVTALADAAPAAVPAWQRVTVIRTERTLAALVRCAGDRIMGFAAHEQGPLASTTPLLQDAGQLGRHAPELLPEPSDAEIHAAWAQWCRQHDLATPLIEVCPWKLDGTMLRVQAPPILMQELRGRRGAVDGHDWLIIGSGPVRRAVQLHVVAAA